MQDNVQTGMNMLNYIRQENGEEYARIVPEATEDNISRIGNILLNQAYQPQLNMFINTLINRIAMTMIENKSFNNPLAMFKKGSIPYGTDIQAIFTNPAQKESYEYSDVAMAKLLTITNPDTKVAYFRLNRRDLYTNTITREGLKEAFVDYDKFNDFVASIVNSLYSGNYIDEFEYTKKLVDGAYDNNKVIVSLVDAVVDEASAKKFVKKVRATYNKFLFPSIEYNTYSKFSPTDTPVKTWTDKDRICLLISADTMAEIDVDVLAVAFNMSKTELLGRIIIIDKFENPEIQALLCDESFIQIYDNLLRFDEFYNARVMAWNEYLHAWGTYAISPFANAVVFATSLPTPATSISFGKTSSTITGIGTEGTLKLTIEPTNASTDVEFISSNPEIVSVEKVDNKSVKVTSVAVGNANVIANSDNGLSSTISITVTE